MFCENDVDMIADLTAKVSLRTPLFETQCFLSVTLYFHSFFSTFIQIDIYTIIQLLSKFHRDTEIFQIPSSPKPYPHNNKKHFLQSSFYSAVVQNLMSGVFSLVIEATNDGGDNGCTEPPG